MDLAGRCQFGSHDEALYLGVSGGADSVAMLILAVELEYSVTVVHVDHGIRSSSGADAAHVRGLAKHFGTPFELHELALEMGPNLEERARFGRYAAFPERIAVAHTVEDQAETVLLALLRGAGLDGLSGMRRDGPGPDPGRAQRVVRPILDLRRAETEDLCASRGVATVEDPSNTDRAFRRNRVRHELLPLMSDIGDRDVAGVIARQADLLAAEKQLLDDLSEQLDPCDVRTLSQQPLALQRRVIYRWLKHATPTDAASVARVLEVVRGNIKATQVVGGRMVRRSKGRLILESPDTGSDGVTST